MDKVRFACPRCQTIMQTGQEKIGHEVACPQCMHRFRLVESEEPAKTVQVQTNNLATHDEHDLESTTEYSPKARRPIIRPHSEIGAANRTNVFGPDLAQRPVGFQCPYCQTTRTPTSRSEVSQAGWIVFVVLLVMTCFLCVIGLFIRDKYRVCSQCKIRLG